MYNSQRNPEKTTNYTAKYIAYGIILGCFVGAVLGNIYKNQIYYMLIFILAFMLVGYILGRQKDKKVNKQVKEFTYAVSKSTYDKNSHSYTLTLVDKKGNEKNVKIDENRYRALELKKGELVYINKNDKVDLVYSHTKPMKNKSFLDLANSYRNLKNNKEEDKKED